MEAREERGSILSLYRPAIDGDQMEEKPQTPMTGRLPRTVRYVRILIGIQIFRLIGLAFVSGLQNGTLPATFVIPASTWAVALVWSAWTRGPVECGLSRFPYGVDSQHSRKLLIRLRRRNCRSSLPHRRNRASRAQDYDGLLLGAVASQV